MLSFIGLDFNGSLILKFFINFAFCNAVSTFYRVGQLIAGTLPVPDSYQDETSYAFSIADIQTALFANKYSPHFDRLLYDIYVRSRILNIIANTLAHSSVNNNLLLVMLY